MEDFARIQPLPDVVTTDVNPVIHNAERFGTYADFDILRNAHNHGVHVLNLGDPVTFGFVIVGKRVDNGKKGAIEVTQAKSVNYDS